VDRDLSVDVGHLFANSISKRANSLFGMRVEISESRHEVLYEAVCLRQKFASLQMMSMVMPRHVPRAKRHVAWSHQKNWLHVPTFHQLLTPQCGSAAPQLGRWTCDYGGSIQLNQIHNSTHNLRQGCSLLSAGDGNSVAAAALLCVACRGRELVWCVFHVSEWIRVLEFRVFLVAVW